MIIACAADENYAEMAGVFLRSLSVNGDVADVPVFLLGDGLAMETVEKLHVCATGLDFRHVELATARGAISGLPVGIYSPAIYIRLLLPALIPASGRVLYLDCDTMVTRSLRPLIDMDLGSCLVAAAEDLCRAEVRTIANARLGHAPEAPYFNSGVLLFDLDEWRRLDVGGECLRCAQSRDDFWPDQDAINIVLKDRIKTLDRIWNFFSHDALPREAFEPAHIVHFIPHKPLSPNCRHPLFEDYLALRATTPWRDGVLNTDLVQRRIDQVRQMAVERVKRWKQQK